MAERPEVFVIETPLSCGAQHYVLLLVPRLVKDMDRLGLSRIIQCSGLPEHEVTSLYFEFVSVSRMLPDDPASIPPELWDYLIHGVQLMSVLVNTAAQSDLAEARESAVRKFLPQARDAVRHEYEEQCQEGTVEFHLASLLRHGTSPDQSRELCKEAIRLERESRLESSLHAGTEGLSAHQAEIVKAARAYIRNAIEDAPEAFSAVDLVIRLLDLLRSVLKPEPGEVPVEASEASVERIVLGLGNVLFRQELGLDKR